MAQETTGAGETPPKFPTPKFVVNITVPVLVTADSEDLRAAWKDNVLGSAEPNVPTAPGKKKSRVKMQSLVIKMINRLIREEVVPYEAISFMAGPTQIYVRILASATALPIIIVRCERNGVGNVVGLCHVSPLETSLVPPATAGKDKEVSIIPMPIASTSEPSGSAKKQDKDKLATGSDKREENKEEQEDDNSEVSTDKEEEKDETKTVPSTLPSSIAIPFISPERKKQLYMDIARARKEWRDTASRVRVAQVVEEISAGAAFTLDYVAFVICAACVAAVGLATDSGTTVIASMLISPIMGPVLGFTFGTTVRNKSLIRTSLRNEAISLLICIIIGMIFGAIATLTNVPKRRDWPSDEMTSRGDLTGLITGMLIAIPSGVAVALSTLGKNSSGMVGVAISLSLLPPAVNAGICWAYELMLLSDQIDRAPGDDTTYWETGTISFALSLVNIVCIWIAGRAMFGLKEVAPVKQKNAFWSRDIAIYREAERGEQNADLDVINDGIKAALELQEEAARDGAIHHTGEEAFGLEDREVAAARRRALADNATEDAFFFDNKGLLGPVVAGGAVSDALPDEQALQDAAELTQSRRSLYENANKFGGLEEAGEALFDNDLVDGEWPSTLVGDSIVNTDAGIQHQDVAEAVLLQDLF